MSTQVHNEIIKVMEERHAVKEYQKGVKIPKEHLQQLLQAATLAPSAWNLQHWKFLVIEEDAYKEKLLPIAYGQKQIVESSVVVAVLGDLQANLKVDSVFGPLVEAGFLPQETKDALAGQINGAYQNSQVARDEAIRNASLAAMQLMLAAKGLGYDSGPMGGFDPAKLIQEFNIPERYLPVMLIAVGTAATPARASSRLSLDEVVVSNTF
ncbi:nitroreductase family protein [Paenibacillus eucommiae]|uniref:Nitroreductase n=1 Tax=Paenibacillus eucommiae TaxID=1355755 RepID=A0ABS4INV1_9BACL|nr:nitroreductase family protein [Paenibacillus eucommiae]MBP1989224.1 nitroreductase [Paenibacillus eucommiae]